MTNDELILQLTKLSKHQYLPFYTDRNSSEMVESAKVLEETIETLKKIDTVKQICKLWNSNWVYPMEKA